MTALRFHPSLVQLRIQRKHNIASVDGTFKLLLAAREQKVRRVVYAASSSAYGESAYFT
jgi:nucleoside-diphosphate-sugar epimerase